MFLAACIAHVQTPCNIRNVFAASILLHCRCADGLRLEKRVRQTDGRTPDRYITLTARAQSPFCSIVICKFRQLCAASTDADDLLHISICKHSIAVPTLRRTLSPWPSSHGMALYML